MEVCIRKQRSNPCRTPSRWIPEGRGGGREGRLRHAPSWPGVPGEKGKPGLCVLGPPAPRCAAAAAAAGLRVPKSIWRETERAASQGPRGAEARGAGRGTPPARVSSGGGAISAPRRPSPNARLRLRAPLRGRARGALPSVGGAGRAPGPLLLPPSAPLRSPGRKLAAGKELGAATARGGGGGGRG